MKVAIATAAPLRLSAWSRQTTADLYRMAGLAVAVAVPTLFWTFILALATKSFGIAIGTPALTGFGMVLAAWCLVTAPLVMDNRG